MPRGETTSTTTLRLTAADRRALTLLEEELACSKADVIRLGLAALRRDPELRSSLRAERFAAAFLARLADARGKHAQLRVRTDEHGNPTAEWVATRRSGPADLEREVQVQVRRDGETFFIDLIDPLTGVGVRNAYWTTVDGDLLDVAFPVAAVNFWRTAPLDEAQSRTLPDGRAAIAVPQEDGTITAYVLGKDGTTSLLADDQHADWFLPEDER